MLVCFMKLKMLYLKRTVFELKQKYNKNILDHFEFHQRLQHSTQTQQQVHVEDNPSLFWPHVLVPHH